MKKLEFHEEQWNWFCSALALMVALMLVLAGCQHRRLAATHDTVYVNSERVEWQWRHDSIYLDRWHDRWVMGDTVYMRDSVVHYRWHTKRDTVALHDSVYISKSDTTTVEVKKPMSGFAKGQIAGFWALLAAFVLAVAWRLWRKLRV